MGNFTIDDAFEMSLEDTKNTFGSLHFGDPDTQQNRHKYKNLENDEEADSVEIQDPARVLPQLSSRNSQCSFSTTSNSTQFSHQGLFSWTRHPLIQKNKKVVLSSFLLLLLGLVLILVGVGLQIKPSPDVSSAIFFVPGFLLLIPGGETFVPLLLFRNPYHVNNHRLIILCNTLAYIFSLLTFFAVYHVIFIYCAVKGMHGFQFFYLPYFDK